MLKLNFDKLYKNLQYENPEILLKIRDLRKSYVKGPPTLLKFNFTLQDKRSHPFRH